MEEDSHQSISDRSHVGKVDRRVDTHEQHAVHLVSLRILLHIPAHIPAHSAAIAACLVLHSQTTACCFVLLWVPNDMHHKAEGNPCSQKLPVHKRTERIKGMHDFMMATLHCIKTRAVRMTFTS